MLVCNVSLRPPRGAIAATIAEAVTAADTTTVEGLILAALVDDPAAVTDAIDAYVGEIMLEAATASDTASVEVPAIDAAVDEPVTATDAPDAAAAAYAATYDGLATNTVVSGGGLTVLHNNTTGNSGAVSRAFQSSGKYYFEVKLEGSITQGNYLGIIASTWTSVFSSTQMTSLGTGVSLGSSSLIYSNGASTAKNLGTQAVGDVYSFAIDLTARLGWIRKNGGNWNVDGTANPATGTGGVTIAAGSFAPIVRFTTALVSTDQMTGNFGQAAFVYTAPSGFGTWPASLSQRYFDRMTVQPSTAVKNAITAFLDGLSTDGVLQKLDAAWLMNLHTEQASRLNIISSSYTLTDVGAAPTWVSGVGGAGGFTAAGAALSTDFAVAIDGVNMVQNSAHIALRSWTSPLSTANDIGQTSSFMGLHSTGAVIVGRINSSTNVNEANASGAGFFAFDRVNATDCRFYRAGLPLTLEAATSTAAGVTSLYVCGVNPSAVSTRRQSFACVGASLGDAGHAALNTRLLAFEAAIGAT